MANSITAIILATDEGSQMNSTLPQVLHEVAGKPMIDYALEDAQALKPQKIYVVVGASSSQVVRHIGKKAQVVVQKQRLGTGHAVEQVVPYLKSLQGHVVVLCGNACLIRPQTVQALRQFHFVQDGAATLLSARVQDPFGYGRIVRDHEGTIEKIVEEKDASEEEREMNEVHSGLCIFKTASLVEALRKLKGNTAKKQSCLSDAVRFLIHQGSQVHALMVSDASEVLGVNDREQLARAHRILNLRRIEEYQRKGVTFLNPQTVEMDAQVVIGQDVVIEGNVHLRGETVVGRGSRVESGSRLQSAYLGKKVVIRSSYISHSRLGDESDAGPHAHVRGGSVLEKKVHVGTNAELKNARIASGSKVGHFSYVGDAQLGQNVNVGAGCVFANYDGRNKHQSKIGHDVFLGSNSTLVAPVTIGPRAVIGAGAVVTKNVPPDVTVIGVPARVMRPTKR